MASLPIVESDNHPWYKKGLNFKCTGCGACCTKTPGYIWVSKEEIEKIATFLKISLEEFASKYLRSIGNKLSLKELPVTYDCIFLKENRCSIYPVRPVQCGTYPFWPTILESEKNWQDESGYCEGICSSSPLVPFERIEAERLLQIHDGYLKE
ncbi:MAG: hypothetical protein K0S07_1167 [Chlamydiales bacterium]|jgi:Fe-S-cluster containining protein|nr:hypothetical protein [Chlamydiales bacterium]